MFGIVLALRLKGYRERIEGSKGGLDICYCISPTRSSL